MPWWALPFLALAAYLALWPTPADPVAWQPQADAGHTGVHAVNQGLAGLAALPLDEGQSGPEFILAHGGVLYTGLAQGEVLRLNPEGTQRSLVLNTGGRPLGLDVDAAGRLLVADAVKGLLRVTLDGPGGKPAQVEPILAAVQHPVPHDPVRYANAVKVARDGTLWLTDASRRFGPQVWGGTFEASVLDTLEHSCTGRLIAQDPLTLRARVALQGLCFPNGLAFSADGKRLFVSETGSYRILALDLARLSLVRTAEGETGVPTLAQAMQQGAASVLIGNLPGFPDNLTVGQQGRIWVGLTKPRSPVVDFAAAHPWLRTLTLRLPRAWWPVPKPYGHVVAFDEQGRILDDLQDPQGTYPDVTSATEWGGKLFVQSLNAPHVGWRPYAGPVPGH